MKKLLLALFVLVLIALIGLGVFIATFNADRYRPLLVQKIEEATGKKVSLGRLSLIWDNGIAVRLQNLAIYTDGTPGQKASAKLEEASCVVRLLPLLRKEIQIVSIVLRAPVLNIVRSKEGALTAGGVDVAAPAASKPSKAKPEASNLHFLVDTFKIRDGELGFHDFSGQNPLHLKISDLDLDVNNFSLNSPVVFDLRMGIFSASQNIAAKGKVLLPQANQPAVLENFSFATDLSSFNLDEIKEAFPAMAQAGIQAPLSGELDLQADRVELGPDALKSLVADIRLKDATVVTRQLGAPIEQLNLDLRAQGERWNIRDASGRFAEGNFKISGSVDRPLADANSDFEATFQDFALADLMPEAASNAPRLNGRVSLGLKAKASGKDWPQISETLSGNGRLLLKDGVLMNYNVLREVVQKMSAIPGVGDALQTNFPEMYRAKLGEPSTILQPLDIPFEIHQGRLFFNNLAIATDGFSINGSGSMGLDKTLSAQALLRMNQPLSQGLVQASPQLKLLLNARGELEMPVQMEGVLPKLMVLPDTQYLFSKIAVSKAPEIINSLINKSQDGKSPLSDLLGSSSGSSQSAAATPATQAATQESPETQIANMLNKMLQKDE